MSYSQQDLLLDSFQDCLIAVYGAMELALRSAEAFNDTLRPSMAQVVFTRVLRLIWMLFFFFFFFSSLTGRRLKEVQQATVLIIAWVKQLSPRLTFNMECFNYISLGEKFLIK